ncbi:hypothetical protein ACJBSE_10350, partial [Streptococcus suis]
KFTLKQDYFQIDGKTLLILCEDGEDEYDAMEMLRYGVVIERLEDREELSFGLSSSSNATIVKYARLMGRRIPSSICST